VSATDYNYLFKKVFGMVITQSRQALWKAHGSFKY